MKLILTTAILLSTCTLHAQEIITRQAIFEVDVWLDGEKVPPGRDGYTFGREVNHDEGYVQDGEWISLGDDEHEYGFWREFHLGYTTSTRYGEELRYRTSMRDDGVMFYSVINPLWASRGVVDETFVPYPTAFHEPFDAEAMTGPWHWFDDLVIAEETFECPGFSCLVPERTFTFTLASFGWFPTANFIDQPDLDFVLVNWGAIVDGQRIDQVALDGVLANWGEIQRPDVPVASGAVPEPPTWVLVGLIVGAWVVWPVVRRRVFLR